MGTSRHQALPEPHARWMAGALGEPMPVESLATCDECPLCAPPSPDRPSDIRFDSRTKCCTYNPQLPNFLVGAILASPDPALAPGRAALERGVGRGLLATPLCLGPPRQYWAEHDARPDGFGRDSDRLCPYHVAEGGGRCGIWRHRGTHCATWFCRYVEGTRSVVFWRSVERLLASLERTLARWCLLCLDVDPDVLRRVCPPRGTPIDLSRPDAVWGRWRDRERELYEACWRRVEPLEWDDLVEIGGSDLQLRVTLVRDAFARLSESPTHVRFGHVESAEDGGNGCLRVLSYNRLDPVDVPRDLLETVRSWDTPRSVETALAEGAAAGLDETMLDRLLRFGVLTPS